MFCARWPILNSDMIRSASQRLSRVSFGRFFDYAAPIVYPNYSETSIRRLQLVQNKALRLITGAHQAAAPDHLHEEGILPVPQHLRLLASQHLAKSLQPSHPSHHLVSSNPAPQQRRKKETLRSKCWETVSSFLTNDVVPPGEIKPTLTKIHTKVVEECIAALAPNRILNSRPPQIDVSERLLPRQTRATLSQLRSGHCFRLNDFQLRVGGAASDRCPDCSTEAASSTHLFNCAAHPTYLTTKDLWEKPREVAVFLSSLPAFADLPDPGPLSPPPRASVGARPPPEPPPSPPAPPASPASSMDSPFSSLSLNSSWEGSVG